MDLIAPLEEAAWGKILSRHALKVIWTAKWNLVKVLYVLNRYFLADIFLYYAYLELANVEKLALQTCRISFITSGGEFRLMFQSASSTLTQVNQVFVLMGLALAEVVIFLRLYALSGQSKVYRVCLPTLFITVQVTACCLTGLFFNSVKYAPSPLPEHIACLPISGSSNIATAIFGLIMANETVVLLVMVYLGLKKHRQMRSPLITIFYRDGIVFFMALAGTSIVNIVLLFSLPPTSNTMFVIPQRSIHSILASRMIIRLREQSYYQENGHEFKDRLDLSILSCLSFRAGKSNGKSVPRGPNSRASFLDMRDMMHQTSASP
ncbi:hypothetical protein MD484_g7865, partial [Candolleomyces efflorescens]